MSPHYARSDPRGKTTGGMIAVHPPNTPPPPSIVTLVVPADGAVAAFARLEAAVAACDYRAASTIRRELYRRGWSIIPPRSPSWPGGRS